MTVQQSTYILVEFLRPSAVQRLLTAVSRIGRVPLAPCVGPEATGEAKIVKLRRGFSVGSSVFALGQDASFSVFFDGLNFQVLEHVDLSPRDQLWRVK